MKFLENYFGPPPRKSKAGGTGIKPLKMEYHADSCKKSLSENDSADDESSGSCSTREKSQQARNISEKRRRDKLNLYINELSSMLPSGTSRKLDKSSVLKIAVNYLKIHNDLSLSVMGDGKTLKSSILSTEELGQLMLEALGGFLLVMNRDGVVIYVADSIKPLIGIDAAAVAGEPLAPFVHFEDMDRILEELSRPLEPTNSKEGEEVDLRLFGDTGMDCKNESGVVSLHFRMIYKKNGNENEYRELFCRGKWRSWVDKDADSQTMLDAEKVLVMLACLKPHSDLREVASSEGPKMFSSRHSMDGKFLFVDTNSSQVTGYLPYELLGTSLYSYVYSDDIEEVARAHRSLMSSMDTVMLFFRFQSKGLEWLLLRATCRVTYNPMTSKPQYFTSSFALASADEIAQFRKLKQSNSETNPYQIPPEISQSQINNENENSKNKSKKIKNPNSVVPTKISAVPMDEEKKEKSSLPLKDKEGEKEESQERFLEAQRHLHDQLTSKQNKLLRSFELQTKQLNNISDLVSKLREAARKDPTLTGRFQHHQEMLDYVNNTFKTQKTVHGELHRKLQDKIKELDTQQRAIDLRRKAMLYKKMLQATQKRHHPFSPQQDQMTVGKRVVPKGSDPPTPNVMLQNLDSSQAYSNTRNNESTPTKQQPWKGSRDSNASVRDIVISQSNPSTESLQNQLQKLQQKEDILSNQDVVSPLQGELQSNQQNDFLQLFVQQQQGNQQQPNKQQINTMIKERETGLSQFLDVQSPSPQNMLLTGNNRGLSQSRSQEPTDLFQTLTNISLNQNGPRQGSNFNDQQTQVLSQQILLQLQVLQQQLLSQIEMIQRPRDNNQPLHLIQLIPALQQLQEAQQVLLEKQQQQSQQQQQQQEQQKQLQQQQQQQLQQQEHIQQQEQLQQLQQHQLLQLQQLQQQHQQSKKVTKDVYAAGISHSQRPSTRIDLTNFVRQNNGLHQTDTFPDMLRRTSHTATSCAASSCDTSATHLNIAQSSPFSPRLRTSQNSYNSCTQSTSSTPMDYGACTTVSQSQSGSELSGLNSRIEQDRQTPVTYANVSSSNVGSYLSSESPCQDIHRGPPSNTDMKYKKLEEEDFSHQPLLANQQQLIQWQRAQRLQIIRQQQEQFEILQQGITSCVPQDRGQQQQQQSDDTLVQQQQKQSKMESQDSAVTQSMFGTNSPQGQGLPGDSAVSSPDLQGLEQSSDRMSTFDLFDLMCQHPLTELDEDGEQVVDLLIAENDHLWCNPENTF